MNQFSTTVETVTSAAVDVLPMNSPAALVQENDVDQDDLPSGSHMDVDSSCEISSDSEQSIISGPDIPVEEYHEHEETQQFPLPMDGNSDLLHGLDFDELPETFDFLPDPDLDVTEEELSPRLSTFSSRRTRRTLIDIEAEKPTYKWHQTAGQVYGQESTIHAHWQSVFNAGPDVEPYKPFHSQLDWEIAQWAIKEKIPQKSFNRLLSIPQVLFL